MMTVAEGAMFSRLMLFLGSACAAMPWPYDWDRFPAAWFGSNKTEWESPAQIKEIGKYSMAILGWQVSAWLPTTAKR